MTTAVSEFQASFKFSLHTLADDRQRLKNLEEVILLHSSKIISRFCILPLGITLLGFSVERRELLCDDMVIEQGLSANPLQHDGCTV